MWGNSCCSGVQELGTDDRVVWSALRGVKISSLYEEVLIQACIDEDVLLFFKFIFYILLV